MTTSPSRSASLVASVYADPGEASIEALTAQLLDAASADEREAVLEDARAAQRLAGELREHRKRAAELTSLNDLAVRLASMHDLPALLHQTVANARQLLGVDLAYLALREDDRSLVIRVTDGGLSKKLEGIVIPPGSGLAGRVVDLGEPVQSADYLNDTHLAHSKTVDAAAVSEGVRAILGTPLNARGNLFGVLMVSQRTVRTFDDQEVSLLNSLAAIAAVAIDNAQLIDQYRVTGQQLEATNTELEERVASVNQAASLHEALLTVALGGGGVDELIRGLSQVFPGDLRYADEQDHVVHAATAGRLTEPGPLAPVQGVPASELFASAAMRKTAVDGSTVTVPVATSQVYFGALQTTASEPLDDAELRSLERAAMTLALVASGERAVTEAERRSAVELLEQLLAGRGDADGSLARRARQWGLNLLVPHRVVVTEPTRGDLGRLRTLGQDLVGAKLGMAEVISGALVVVVRAEADDVRAWASGVAGLGTTGYSDAVVGVTGVQAAYKEAKACVSALLAMDRVGEAAAAEDLGPYRFLLSQAGKADAVRFVKRTVGPLMAHDEARGTELLRTTDAFLTNGRQHAATAAKLQIHPNTLYQRLERIAALLGDDWREGDRALDVQMALRIHRLVQDAAAERSG